VKYYDWNREKNELLKQERDISFEDVVNALNEGRILDIFKHPNQKKYPNQKIYVIEIGNYAYFVPFIEDENKIFLKTIYPSRNATKRYLKKRKLRL